MHTPVEQTALGPEAVAAAAQRLVHQLRAAAAAAAARQRWLVAAMVGLAIAIAAIAACSSSLPEPLALAAQMALVLLALALMVGLLSQQRPGPDARSLATAAAQLERSLYLFRTLLQTCPERYLWLGQQVTQTQLQWQAQLAGVDLPASAVELAALPDLLAAEYLAERLAPQLPLLAQQLDRAKARRWWLQLAGLLSAIAGVGLPLLGPVGMAASAIAGAMTLGSLLGWQLADLDRQIAGLSQRQQALAQRQDHWRSLPIAAWTAAHFVQQVMWVEMVLALPLEQLSPALPALAFEVEPDLLQQVQQRLPASLEKAFAMAEPTPSAQPPITAAQALPEPPPKPPAPASKRGRPHVFVVMPFGRKQGAEGRWYDFNSIYQGLIKPAIEAAGFEAFRADEEEASGDIITDMFQELLLADMVVADLSIDNANAFYELGIRHALRRRGVVHIQAGRAYMPFDIFNVRTLPYHCDDSGGPDPAFIEKDRQALTKILLTTWNTDRSQSHSPIFNVLTGLSEPDRKMLQTPLARGYWQEYTNLQMRISTAQRQKRIGDVVLLAEEVSNPLIKEDIIVEAGAALRNMGNSALALKEYRQGLKLNPDNVTLRCEEALHLSHLGQFDEAIVKLEQLLRDVPTCVDAASKLARIYKDLWRRTWDKLEDASLRLQAAYESSFLLQKAIANYLRGYQLDQNEYYPGINALSMTVLLDHLAIASTVPSGDEDEAAFRRRLPALQGAVQFSLESALEKAPNDPWVALSLGELAVCLADFPQQVATAYRKALTLLWNNRFALRVAIDQLQLMQLLNFRPEHVQAGLMVLKTELERYSDQGHLLEPTDVEKLAQPNQVFLFSGHMIDRASRPKPRFPAAMEAEAAARIEVALDQLAADANSIGIVPGLACGGDILFVEACLKRGMKIEAYLPFESSVFIQESVGFAGDVWVERFYSVFNHPNVTIHLQIDRLGPVPEGDNAFERNNRWTLYSTLVYNIKAIRLIVLWDGQGGSGPGGTADMVQQVRQLGGIVEHLDTTKFDYWKQSPALKGAAVPLTEPL